MALRHLKVSETVGKRTQGYLDRLHYLEGHPIETHSGIVPRLPTNHAKFVVLEDFVIPHRGWYPEKIWEG